MKKRIAIALIAIVTATAAWAVSTDQHAFYPWGWNMTAAQICAATNHDPSGPTGPHIPGSGRILTNWLAECVHY